MCHGCAWDRRPGSGRGHAVWLVFFVTGVAELHCNRHAQQAFKVGGFGWRLEDLPPVVANPTSIDRGVVEFARPDPIDEQYKRQLANEIRAMVLLDLADVVVTMALSTTETKAGVSASAKKRKAAAS